MKHKRSSSRFLALLICLSLVLTPLAAFAAEGGSVDDQDAAQASEMMEEDEALSAPSSDAEEASFEDAADDQEDNADGELQADPEDSEGAEQEDQQEADPAEPSEVEEGDVIDDTEAANSGDTEYEISDPEEPEDETPVDENGEIGEIGEIIEELGEIPAVEMPALADVANASAPSKVWVELQLGGESVIIDSYTHTNEDIKQIFLPGSVNINDCHLYWDNGSQVTINGQNYLSGECPLPDVSTTYNSNPVTYRFNNGTSDLASFRIVTYQGSPNVRQFFIDIDESRGTIAAMDANKENICYGRVNIDGTWYEVTKMKGRGNVTWNDAKDKKPYNITIDKKIDLGLSSGKTKKWSLLAEINDRSLMCNRVGFALGSALGVSYDATSADVWMNGEYQGCYTVTPKTDSYIAKEGYLLEEDNYNDGGDYFNIDGIHGQNGTWASVWNHFAIKEWGDDTIAALTNGGTDEAAARQKVKEWFQAAWDAIRYKGDYSKYLDVESFAKVYLVEEFVKNYDVCAGSLMFHRDGLNDFDDKLYAGPVWDLDNAFGSTNSTFGGGADLKSAKGDFIQSINEDNYKTSIYKTFYRLNEGFKTEVKKQYTLNRSTFTGLANTLSGIRNQIEASALMNNFKVKELSCNNHLHDGDETLERYDPQYEQKYKNTKGSLHDDWYWGNYADNLNTYITVRSRWFENNYYDPNVCVNHNLKETKTDPTCTEDGKIVRECQNTNCDYTETEVLPALGHTPDEERGICTRCGEAIPKATFVCPDGLTVTVSYKKDFSGETKEDAKFAYPRGSKTGEIDMSGEGQVNFEVKVKDGYELDGAISVSGAPTSSFNKFRGKEETGVDNRYNVTKVNGDFTVTVEATVKAVVTFDSDNGTEPTKETIEVGKFATKPEEDPQKEGFVFEGWYLVDAEGNMADEAFDFEGTPITEPITLKAKWESEGVILKSANVDFDGQIKLIFEFSFPDELKADTGAYVLMEKSVPNSNSVPTKTLISDGAKDGTIFTLPVMIPEFADKVTVTVHDGNDQKVAVHSSGGTDYTDGFEYSVKDYAENRMEKSDNEKMRALAQALYDYGTTAQIYFKYGDYSGIGLSDDSPVHTVTLEDIKPYKAKVVIKDRPEGFNTASIMTFFESDNTLRILFNLKDGKKASDYTFTFGNDSYTPVKRNTNDYCIDVKNIAAPNLDVPYSFSISDGTNTYALEACAMSYAYTSVKNGEEPRQNLGKAFYLYNQAANDFFGE